MRGWKTRRPAAGQRSAASSSDTCTASAPTLHLQGKEGVPAVLHQMRDYCISREDIDFITGKAGSGCCQPHPCCCFSIQSCCGHVHTHTNAWPFQCFDPPRSLPACPSPLAPRRDQVQDQGCMGRGPHEGGGHTGVPAGPAGLPLLGLLSSVLGCTCWACTACWAAFSVRAARLASGCTVLSGVPSSCAISPCSPQPAWHPLPTPLAGQVGLHPRLQPAARQAAHRLWHGRQGAQGMALFRCPSGACMAGSCGRLLMSPTCRLCRHALVCTQRFSPVCQPHLLAITGREEAGWPALAVFCHFFSSLMPFISPAATAQVKKKRGGKGRAKAADDDDEDVFGGEAAACCNEHGWEAGPCPASVCAPPMCTNGHNAARCLTPPRPIPPRCDAGEGLVQEQASPTKSGEEGEGEEEQDLEELDPVALQKKVGRGAVAWGHPCERFRKLWAGLQEQADTAIRL